jgi:hypothetical protein
MRTATGGTGSMAQIQQFFDGVTVICLNFWPVFVAGVTLLAYEIREDRLKKERFDDLHGMAC